MQYGKFSEELKNKKRSVADLQRFISTQTDNNPNYTLMLGAGCSVTSGIRPANALTELWRKELYLSCAGENSKDNANITELRDYLRQHEGSWYDLDREYSSLFEKKYDLQRQRRMFVETEASNKLPSIGYAYLTSLVEGNYFNTIFTTNFDDLINEAFYLYSDKRPIVCAHDSSINSVTVTSKRPKIIKLHGDYLFDDLKSTIRETETLEQNMKSKFIEFFRDYGLIVVGYSGGDRSIMDILSTILRNDEYFKSGIYWCLRKSSEIPEELRKLMWRDRVYFVEIDGFDELFAELYSGINCGAVLPEKALSMTRRPTEVANRLLSDNSAFPTTNAVLTKAREKLVKHSKRTTLANLFFNTDGNNGDKLPLDTDLNDDELIQLTEVQNLITSDNSLAAIDKARDHLNATPKRSVRVRLHRLMLEAYMRAGDVTGC